MGYTQYIYIYIPGAWNTYQNLFALDFLIDHQKTQSKTYVPVSQRALQGFQSVLNNNTKVAP